jgi:hypothetical protein
VQETTDAIGVIMHAKAATDHWANAGQVHRWVSKPAARAPRNGSLSSWRRRLALNRCGRPGVERAAKVPTPWWCSAAFQSRTPSRSEARATGYFGRAISLPKQGPSAKPLPFQFLRAPAGSHGHFWELT